MSNSIRCVRGLDEPCSARRWATKNSFHIGVCDVCSHGFVLDSISQNDLEAFYESHAKYLDEGGYESDLRLQDFPGSRSDAHRYISLFEKTLGARRQPISFLEVGAGWAYASRNANEKGWHVDSIEYSRQCVDSLRKCLPVSSIVWAGSFESFAHATQKKYDCILMSQVLEHALDPSQWLIHAYDMLNHGGCLIVAVPQFKGIYGVLGVGDPYITPPEHLNFFTRRSLQLLAERVGFKVDYVTGYSRIPFYNIKRKIKYYLPSIILYRLLQVPQFLLDLCGISGIQVQVLRRV